MHLYVMWHADRKWEHLSHRTRKWLEKKEDVLLRPFTKSPVSTENSKMQRDNTNMPPQTSITQWLRTDFKFTVSWSNNSYPTGVVNGISIFPLTTKAVYSKGRIYTDIPRNFYFAFKELRELGWDIKVIEHHQGSAGL